MADYDPQKIRGRRPVRDDEPAPVDALLAPGSVTGSANSASEVDETSSVSDPLAAGSGMGDQRSARRPAPAEEFPVQPVLVPHSSGRPSSSRRWKPVVVAVATVAAVLVLLWLRRSRRVSH